MGSAQSLRRPHLPGLPNLVPGVGAAEPIWLPRRGWGREGTAQPDPGMWGKWSWSQCQLDRVKGKGYGPALAWLGRGKGSGLVPGGEGRGHILASRGMGKGDVVWPLRKKRAQSGPKTTMLREGA